MTDLRVMFARLSLFDDGSLLVELQIKLAWIEQIKAKQIEDESLGLYFQQVKSGNAMNFGLNNEGVLYFRGRIYVPKDMELRQSILREVHSCPCAMHPSGNKMYRDFPSQDSTLKVGESDYSRLPLTPTKNDSVWVIVNRLTKFAYFIPVRTDYSLQKLAKLYVSKIVRLHGYCLPTKLELRLRKLRAVLKLPFNELQLVVVEGLYLRAEVRWKKKPSWN
ncbi:uncharacterized protein LOC108481487 [Gossypium arboreum]|uniref:uncharacterized protein LOC108481487 n=1 Tax=Gossypium arboreum TaxID=29729 RepID=UPI0008193F5E|nr:uncharacterized protein LOC108481487 [Gossypium arboreum]